ncbi:MAG: hypothetical protein WEB30_06825 [Cyclobacteriaceae bacterium]
MKRRSFIGLSIAAGGALLAWYVLDFKRIVTSILRKDTENFSFAGKDIEDIVETFLMDADKEQFWNIFSTSKRIFIGVQHFFHGIGIQLPYHRKYLQYRSAITGQFLFSTDLFLNASDGENKTLHYRGFFNPYKNACGNPFSNLRIA